VVSAVSLALLRVPGRAGRAQANFWSELAEGLRAVTSRRWYLLNLGAHAMWNFAIAAFFVLGPVVAKEHLGGASAQRVVVLQNAVSGQRWSPSRDARRAAPRATGFIHLYPSAEGCATPSLLSP